MARITRPGKFEGEQAYAPYFYDLMLEGEGGGDEGDEKAIYFDVTPEDVAKFPELQGRSRVAFYESDDGFWIELEFEDRFAKHRGVKVTGLDAVPAWIRPRRRK